MKYIFLILLISTVGVAASYNIFNQPVLVNSTLKVGAKTANTSSAQMEVVTTSKGSIACPKMTTTQKNAISTPSEGLCVFDTTTHKLNYYNGSIWIADSSPLTTKGDLFVFSSTNDRIPISGNDGYVLTENSSAAEGVSWTAQTGDWDSQGRISNLSLTASVGSSALTIEVKNKAGNDPSAGDPVKIAFRNATSATGDYSVATLSAALSLVISSGSKLGHADATAHYIYVYMFNDGGTLRLAVSSKYYDEGAVQSATAEGGAGAADAFSTIYSDAAITSKAMRLIGRLKTTQTTAGTWAAVPSEISLVPFKVDDKIVYLSSCSGKASQNVTSEAGVIVNATPLYDTVVGQTAYNPIAYTVKDSGIYTTKLSILGYSSGGSLSLRVKIKIDGTTKIHLYPTVASGAYVHVLAELPNFSFTEGQVITATLQASANTFVLDTANFGDSIFMSVTKH